MEQWPSTGFIASTKAFGRTVSSCKSKTMFVGWKDKISGEALTKIENIIFLSLYNTVKWKMPLYHLYSPYDVIVNYQNENVVSGWMQGTNK